MSVLQRLVGLGVREIAADTEWLADDDFRRLYRFAQPPLVLHTPAEEGPTPIDSALPVPRLSFFPHTCAGPSLERALLVDRPVHILLLPQSMPDPLHPGRLFFDTRPSLTLNEFIRRLDRWGS